MEPIVFFHNPKAGDSDHESEKLLSLIEKQGFSCQYNSIKSKSWQDFDEEAKFLIAAGGDGCVRTVVEMLLSRTLMQRQFPLAIVPLGTANNVSRTLGIDTNPVKAIAALKTSVPQKLDVGFVEGFGKSKFFIEGAGIGVFPALMKRMKKNGKPAVSTKEKLEMTLRILEEIVQDFKALPVKIVADGTKVEGDYLMAEVMNTKSIGPNLVLAENADPTDGEMELVLIPVEQREKLLHHIRAQINGKVDDFSYTSLKSRNLIMSVPETRMHFDDELMDFPGGKLQVYLKKGILEIMAPGS